MSIGKVVHSNVKSSSFKLMLGNILRYNYYMEYPGRFWGEYNMKMSIWYMLVSKADIHNNQLY